MGLGTVDPATPAGYLGVGQQQLVEIAGALSQNCKLLILDEPTNHLDLPSIEELENALDSFGGGILYISHDTYFINRMGGKVVEL